MLTKEQIVELGKRFPIIDETKDETKEDEFSLILKRSYNIDALDYEFRRLVYYENASGDDSKLEIDEIISNIKLYRENGLKTSVERE